MIARATDMRAIAPLFDGWDEKLARSTLDGCMGSAWANEACTAAQIVNGDFAFLAGDPDAEDAEALMTHVPEDYSSAWLLISSKGGSWDGRLAQTLGERATRLERYAIKKEPDAFDRERLQAFANKLPDGVTLRRIDGALYAEAQKADWSCDFVSQFADADDYARRGLGYMALYDGKPIAGASSYVVYNGGVEIEIDTVREWRRRGLATACASALILGCMERGLYASWDAANRASVALAEKLGYHYDHSYTTFSLHLSR